MAPRLQATRANNRTIATGTTQIMIEEHLRAKIFDINDLKVNGLSYSDTFNQCSVQNLFESRSEGEIGRVFVTNFTFEPLDMQRIKLLEDGQPHS